MSAGRHLDTERLVLRYRVSFVGGTLRFDALLSIVFCCSAVFRLFQSLGDIERSLHLAHSCSGVQGDQLEDSPDGEDVVRDVAAFQYVGELPVRQIIHLQGKGGGGGSHLVHEALHFLTRAKVEPLPIFKVS